MQDRPDPVMPDPWADDPAATQRTPIPDPTAASDPPLDAARAGAVWADPRSSPTGATPPAAGGPLSAAPGRREARPRRDDGRAGSIVFGLLLLGVGVWFFLDETLGLALPELHWDQLWPVILIGIGLWIVLGARRGAD